DDSSGQVKGYASATSVNKGDSIAFNISVNPPQAVTLTVYRLGWYGGSGGRLVTTLGPFNGITQPPCPEDVTTGLIECHWSSTTTLTVPDTWTSGIFVGVLSAADKFQNYVLFTVRDDSRPADLLVQQSVTTYQAYSGYPN